jgi:sterol 3beta-glucosyltransferase
MVMRQIASALAQAGVRGLVATGSNSNFDIDLPPTIHPVGDIPHSWLFPRMAAVVHHGGAGTTAAALRAGKPSLILPLTADQSFWARRVHRLGASPPPLRKRQLQDDVGAGLSAVREDPSIRRAAAEIGERMALEDGAGRAAEEILQVLHEGRAVGSDSMTRAGAPQA